MNTEKNSEFIFQNRYLIMCILISILGFYSTYNIVLEFCFLVLICYSGYTITKRFDSKK